ncbi:hypothetical protein Theco_1288 [Thermobacillus composti KWC4]|uniref:Uncharacterized protein n=1 Tax=Thermobacillus composti (strain DSM 18247 / JCM 13945 / KWC4) TaxID=717605 RepID=L0ECW0_THECK|nr:hypothetical protein [Thermobacillus composti]AGA57454.1 hypothetical protein Theco_1288 [Thermobacillus composti KWC4]
MADYGNLGAAGAAGFGADVHIGAGAAGAIGHHPYASVHPGMYGMAGTDHHHHCVPKKRYPDTGTILVLFILLVIILRTSRL